MQDEEIVESYQLFKIKRLIYLFCYRVCKYKKIKLVTKIDIKINLSILIL